MRQKLHEKILNSVWNVDSHLNCFFLLAYMVSDKLMTAEVKTVSVEKCSSIYKKHNEKIKHPAFQNGIDDSQYCAHGDRLTDKTRSDSCRGDSGGPLQLIRNKYAAHIVGIVSFGLGCGNEFPGIYTRVAHYTQWIASHVWPNALWSWLGWDTVDFEAV